MRDRFRCLWCGAPHGSAPYGTEAPKDACAYCGTARQTYRLLDSVLDARDNMWISTATVIELLDLPALDDETCTIIRYSGPPPEFVRC
jgi:hypothetical protein